MKKKWMKLLRAVADRAIGTVCEDAENIVDSYVAAGLAELVDAPPPELDEQTRAEVRTVGREMAVQFARELRAGAQAGARRPNVGGDGASLLEFDGDIAAGESEEEKIHARTVGNWFRSSMIALSSTADSELRSRHHNRLVEKWSKGGYGVRRGLNEGTGGSGGYTTPVMYETQIFQIAAETGVIVPGAAMKPLGARSVEWPALNQYAAPTSGQSAFFGGVTVARKGESAQRSASQPGFNKVALSAIDLTAYTEMSRDLLDDSTAVLDAYVPDLLGKAIGWREDWECINGTGAGQFLGIVNAACTINLSRNTSSHIKYQDVFGLYVRLYSAGKKNAVWVVHPYTVSELLQIVDGSGRFIMIPWQPAGNDTPLGAAQATGFRMLGLPVLESEKAPVLGSTGDLMLCDRSAYFLGRRNGLEIGYSEHFKFDTDQIAIRAKLRNDGQPGFKKAITLADGTNTVSGFAMLV